MRGATVPDKSEGIANGKSNVVILGRCADSVKLNMERPMDRWSYVLYAYLVSGWTNVFQLFRWSASYFLRNRFIAMVYFLTCRFVWGCYAIVKCFNAKNPQNVPKSLLISWKPLCNSTRSGITYGTIQWSTNTLTTCIAALFQVWIALVMFVYLFVIPLTNTSTSLVHGIAPRICLAKNYRNSVTGNSCNFRNR